MIARSFFTLLGTLFQFLPFPGPAFVSVNTGFVQQSTAQWTSGTSYAVTMGSAPANGDVLVLSGQELLSNNVPSTISSISSTNTTWTKDSSLAFGAGAGSGNGEAELWHGAVSGGAGGTTITITLTGSSLSGGTEANISEWNNIIATLDGSPVTSGCNTGCGITVATGAFSTTMSNDLVFAVNANNKSIATNPGSPYSLLTTVGGGLGSAYHALAPSGSQTAASWTLGGTASGRAFGSIIAAYEP